MPTQASRVRTRRASKKSAWHRRASHKNQGELLPPGALLRHSFQEANQAADRDAFKMPYKMRSKVNGGLGYQSKYHFSFEVL